MAKIKRVFAIVLALALVFSLATTSASAIDFKASKDAKFDWGLDNILKPEVGVDRNATLDLIEAIDGHYNLTILGKEIVDATVGGKVGYRVHLIQPTTGITLYDGIVYYDRGTGVITFEKDWNLAQFPDLSKGVFERMLNNTFKSIYDTGIIIDDVSLDLDVLGKDVIDYTVSNQGFIITAGHLDKEDIEAPADETPADETPDAVEVPADVTPQGAATVEDDAPAAAGEAIANTGDAGIAAVVAISTLAGAAFVAAKKH